MESWVLITIAAAFLQNIRSMLQKHLKGAMSTTSATFVRFGFGLPFALAFVAMLHYGPGYPIPVPNPEFVGWVILGGLTQILATFLLLYIFGFRNFVVGTAYSRTEPAQAALFAMLFLGEHSSSGTLLAIAISVVGVMVISVARSASGARSLLTSLVSRSAAAGIASGTAFGIAAVSYRAASLSLGYPGYLMQAAVTLASTISFQTIVMLVWMLWRERGEFLRIKAAWKMSAIVGMVGATASFGWFTAMTLQQAAVIKALAQVEILFTIATSVLFFREKINRLELAGSGLIIAGILALLYVG
ncbi:MAG: DMT family transporter [Nitratireductor sp.]